MSLCFVIQSAKSVQYEPIFSSYLFDHPCKKFCVALNSCHLMRLLQHYKVITTVQGCQGFRKCLPGIVRCSICPKTHAYNYVHILSALSLSPLLSVFLSLSHTHTHIYYHHHHHRSGLIDADITNSELCR